MLRFAKLYIKGKSIWSTFGRRKLGNASELRKVIDMLSILISTANLSAIMTAFATAVIAKNIEPTLAISCC